jgi:UDP-N-acetylglucosamine 2-epimerase (non-hydrolysing)
MLKSNVYIVAVTVWLFSLTNISLSHQMTSKRKKIAVIFGTRPDAIKLAPVIIELKKHSGLFNVVVIATAQHRQMMDQVLKVFRIKTRHDLNIMKPRQSLAALTARAVTALDRVLAEEKPDMVLVQGDTSTTFVGSLAAFYQGIPVGHVEAGLRTHDRHRPFPEEINRRLTGGIAELHFVPTATAKRALLREGVSADSILVTGNSGIDALKFAVKQAHRFSRQVLSDVVRRYERIVLVTMHRRENLGKPMRGVARAIRQLAAMFPDVGFVLPVHRNPVVRETIRPILSSRRNIHLTEPLDYLDFVHLMARCHVILTDSGGVQEEGPALGKPVLVMREVTERPEAIRAGTVKLVGLDEKHIVRAARLLLTSRAAYRKMATAVSPYGDGHASQRIVPAVSRYLGLGRTRVSEFSP